MKNRFHFVEDSHLASFSFFSPRHFEPENKTLFLIAKSICGVHVI
jgi:hypothetical protein